MHELCAYQLTTSERAGQRTRRPHSLHLDGDEPCRVSGAPKGPGLSVRSEKPSFKYAMHARGRAVRGKTYRTYDERKRSRAQHAQRSRPSHYLYRLLLKLRLVYGLPSGGGDGKDRQASIYEGQSKRAEAREGDVALWVPDDESERRIAQGVGTD